MNKNKLSCDELVLLEKLLLNAISNGNTINPSAFVPNSKEYKQLFEIMKVVRGE